METNKIINSYLRAAGEINKDPDPDTPKERLKNLYEKFSKGDLDAYAELERTRKSLKQSYTHMGLTELQSNHITIYRTKYAK